MNPSQRAAELAAEDAQSKELTAALRRANQKLAKAKASKEELVEAVYRASRDAAVAYPPAEVAKFPTVKKHGKENEWALIHWTDWQTGKETRTYSSKVAESRIDAVCEKAEKITDIQRSSHPVDSCGVLLGGDMIEGTTIFPAQAWEVDSGLFDQVFHTAYLIEKSVRRMARSFAHVEVWEEYGNHGRHGRFGEQPATDNFDRMVYRIAMEKVKASAEGPRVVWHPSANFYSIGAIGAYKFLLVHGDEIKSFGGNTPAFGIMRKVTAWASGVLEPFSDCYMGHFHRNDVFALPNGGRVFMGGTLESGSEYAREFCAATGRPSQRLNFIDPKAGQVTAEYTLWV